MLIPILLIDRKVERRQMLAAQLSTFAEFHVTQANDVECSKIAGCDVVLIMHKPADAFEIAHRLHSAQTNVSTILLAAEGSEALAVRAWRQGFGDYLAYPCDAQAVYDSIMRVMDHRIQDRITAETQRQLLAANLELTHYLQGLDKIVEVGKAITADLLLEDVLTTVVQAAAAVMQSDTASILLKDDATGDLFARAAYHARGEGDTVHLPLANQVIHTGQPIILNGDQIQKVATAHSAKNLAYVPMYSGNSVIGVLGIENRLSDRTINSWHVKLLRLLAEFGSIAFDNADTYLRTQYERDTLNAILDGTADPVLVVDMNDCLYLCNPAARAAFHIPEGYYGPADCVIKNDDVRVMLQCRMERQIEITLDDERTYQAQMTVVEGVGYVVVMQDISHLKDLDQIKTNFVASVSQDLRSPLTAIMGYVELLSRAGPVNDLQQTFIDRIALSAQTISDEINDLLDLSRIESSAADTNYEYVHLPMLLDYALATVEGQVAAKQLTLTLDLAKKLPPVWGNAQRLKQMIRNLLENAIMFTPEQGEICITLKPQSDLLLLKIADSGIGISLEDQPHIFDKFYRADAVRDEYEGAGLGLAIVKSILDRHDGRIWVESQPGIGSTFSLLLPVGVKRDPQAMKETAEVAVAVR